MRLVISTYSAHIGEHTRVFHLWGALGYNTRETCRSKLHCKCRSLTAAVRLKLENRKPKIEHMYAVCATWT